MRILALSDIHGAFETMRKIISAEHSADAIVLAGDLTTRGSPADLQEVLEKATAFHLPVLAILGNMDPPALARPLEATGLSLHGSGRTVGGVGFAGVSASPFSPLHTPNEVADEELGKQAEKGWAMIQQCLHKVLVAHTPPFGSATDRIHTGAHAGSPSIRRFIETHQPAVVICGHIHEARGKEVIGKTQVVNCGPAFEGSYAIVEIGMEVSISLMP
ncbi:MAG: metallophosphoesterase [Bacteroidota bacterium]